MVGVLRKGGIFKGIIDELTRQRIFNRQDYPFGNAFNSSYTQKNRIINAVVLVIALLGLRNDKEEEKTFCHGNGRFKELAKELKKQVPDKKKRLQEMLDEIIDDKTDKTKE